MGGDKKQRQSRKEMTIKWKGNDNKKVGVNEPSQRPTFSGNFFGCAIMIKPLDVSYTAGA